MGTTPEYRPTEIAKVSLFDSPIAEFGAKQTAMADMIDEMEPGELLLVADEFSGFRDSKNIHGVFIKDDEFKKTRPHGMHKPEFGRLILSSNKDYEMPTQVAVKPEGGGASPYESPALALAHEWAANEHMNELTDYESAFLPLGVWKSETGQAQLVTLFDESVKTFDRIFWAPNEEAGQINKTQMVTALAIGTISLGYMHGAGLVHGEPHPGNLGRDSKNPWNVDLESLHKLPRNAGAVINDKETRGLIRNDYEQLVGNLLLRRRPGEELFDKITDVLADPEAVEFIVSQYQPAVQEGERSSGVELPQKLAPRPESLARIFRKELDKHSEYLKTS